MYRFLVRIQLFALLAAYLLATYKLWTKEYDPRFCRDVMIFNRISLFWFIHLIFIGVILLLLFILLRRANFKSVIFWELIVIFSICGTLGIAEIYFRLRPERLPLSTLVDLGFNEENEFMRNRIEFTLVDKYNEDSELGFIHKPNLFFELKSQEFSYLMKTDSHGFVNFYDETLYNDADIVTIGDSMTEGVGVPAEFSYPRQLARLLKARVLNLGHGTYDCYQFPIVLRRYGLESHPKIVVMSINCWNDIQLRYPFWRKYCEANGYIPFKDFSIKGNEAKNNKRIFYLSAYLKYVFEQIKISFLQYMALWNYGPYRGIYANGRWFRLSIIDPIAYGGKELEKSLDYLNSTLAQIKNLSQEHQFRVIVLYIPDKEYVYHHFLFDLPTLEKKKGQMKRGIIETVKKMGFEILDLTPFLVKSIEEGTNPYFKVDSHLNKTGYSIVARALADYLRNSF